MCNLTWQERLENKMHGINFKDEENKILEEFKSICSELTEKNDAFEFDENIFKVTSDKEEFGVKLSCEERYIYLDIIDYCGEYKEDQVYFKLLDNDIDEEGFGVYKLQEYDGEKVIEIGKEEKVTKDYQMILNKMMKCILFRLLYKGDETWQEKLLTKYGIIDFTERKEDIEKAFKNVCEKVNLPKKEFNKDLNKFSIGNIVILLKIKKNEIKISIKENSNKISGIYRICDNQWYGYFITKDKNYKEEDVVFDYDAEDMKKVPRNTTNYEEIIDYLIQECLQKLEII